ncbi:hypothetical protein [Autumnicola musiva]|uniref:PKD/Chitinase domain-containing protein n=1 Tax=Autumnicola musiva TaxID=3075589 RepID=A0ABU3D4V7_9FLAO|nr:hypothetical protein [Zunongwangia sp. F117]MDT0676568.1 hypothetical protein [Zunongwangia sp. F117]
MKKHLKIFLSLFLTISILSCEKEDDAMVDLSDLEVPSNLGATFQITQDNSGLVTVTPTGKGAVTYTVDFGDGSDVSEEVQVGEQLEHVYAEGQYDVVVMGSNLNGETAQGTQPLTVSFLAPENLEATVTKDPNDNYSVTVAATAENAAMYEVYFGENEDEEPAALMEGETVSYTYSSIGTYNIRVVALSGGAAATEVTREVVITDPLFLPLDFESATLDYTFANFGGGEGAGAPVVENPDPSGVNMSEMVASYTKPQNSEIWAGTSIPLGEPIDFSSRRYISVDVWSPIAGADVIFKVENLDDSEIAVEFTAQTTVANQWETLTFDLTSLDPSQEYGRLVLFFNYGVPGTGETYYFDNIRQTTLEQIKLPLNFESENLTYGLSGFGGSTGAVIDNPDASGINTSSRVIELTEGAGAESWAGISLNLDEAVNFSSGTTAKMKVWSPEAGVPILLKLENSSSAPEGGNPTVFVEVIQNTTTSEEWEELTFDLSSYEAFDPSIEYDRLVLFYDYGESGEGTTSYFDDVRVTSADEPTAVVLPVNFENPDLTYSLTSFEGAESAVEENPFQQGINTSSMVVRSIKTEGALFYAGTTLQLEEPVDFSNQQKISVKVYSPKEGIPVRLKLENNDDSGIFLQTDATTTLANEWEELVFDFSGEDFSQDYSKVILFFEIIENVQGDGSVYYYDDIQLTN